MTLKDGFLKYERNTPDSRKVENRVNDYKEIHKEFPKGETKKQAARCMDCGIPFCHSGCPLGNIIPEFNEAVFNEDWTLAHTILSETNNFPEFTGRICPAPCEAACVLGINSDPVSIEHIEKTIAEEAFKRNLVKPIKPTKRTNKKVAVIGSGPAGLAAADQLNKSGHSITVFERDDAIGGLLRYGIPDFKLEKWVVERRIDVMKESGIKFITSTEVGKDISAEKLNNEFDAIVICTGATVPRDLNIDGRDAKGVHFAMDFLTEQNKNVYNNTPQDVDISAKGKNVVVIGGGDTGSDCIGTSHRQGAKSVTQIELLNKPLDHRTEKDPWPNWPMTLRTSSSHEEGGERMWSVLTKAFHKDEKGNLEGIQLVNIEWHEKEKKRSFNEIEGTERVIPCEMALLAIGFEKPENQLLEQLNIPVNERGLIKDKKYRTARAKVFAAGDARRGQSLVVWAISEGREAAISANKYLSGENVLESKNKSMLKV